MPIVVSFPDTSYKRGDMRLNGRAAPRRTATAPDGPEERGRQVHGLYRVYRLPARHNDRHLGGGSSRDNPRWRRPPRHADSRTDPPFRGGVAPRFRHPRRAALTRPPAHAAAAPQRSRTRGARRGTFRGRGTSSRCGRCRGGCCGVTGTRRRRSTSRAWPASPPSASSAKSSRSAPAARHVPVSSRRRHAVMPTPAAASA